MSEVAVSFDGKPDCELTTLNDGTPVPAVSPAEMHRLARETVDEQVELGVVAEELGFDAVAYPELHFSMTATLSPTPLTVASAVAAATDRIRLLPAAVPEWHHPIRLAERIGTLDTLSDGRVEPQLIADRGRFPQRVFAPDGSRPGGTGPDDAATTGAGGNDDGTDGPDAFDEAVELLARSWTEPYISYDGDHYTLPGGEPGERQLERKYLRSVNRDPATYAAAAGADRDAVFVAPRPAREPHPPLWRDIASPTDAVWAARRGVNGLVVSRSFDDIERAVDVYHQAAKAADWPDRLPGRDGEPFDRGWDPERRRGLGVGLSVFDTSVADERTIKRWRDGKRFVVDRIDPDGRFRDGDRINLEAALEALDAPVAGDTAHVRDRLCALRDRCGDHLHFEVTFDTHGLSTAAKRRQMESFAENVLPAL